MNKIIFEATAFDDFNSWVKINKKTYSKIVELIKNIRRSPFSGLGKPEPLKNELSGYWSRRINEKDRLVYKVTTDSVIIISCKYHY